MGTFIITGVIALCFTGAIVKIVKDTKKGACVGCSGCEGSCGCHSAK